MADWETVRAFASTLPGAEESTTYGKPAFKVRGKLFAWVSPDDAADGALAVRVDPDELALFVETSPDLYFQTPHYHGHPILLVRMVSGASVCGSPGNEQNHPVCFAADARGDVLRRCPALRPRGR